MADNIDVTPGAGKTIAGDDIGGVLHQRVKTGFGADGSYTDVSAAAPLPVDGSGVTQPVSGPLTDTQLRASGVPVTGTFYPATQPVSGALTNAELRATPVPVSGTVTATGPLTDTQLRATPVPVSGTVTATTGGLTDAQLRASAVTVSGPFLTDAQLRATAVPVSGPLTDTQIRATALPVSGPLTDTQLRAVAVPVSAATLPLPTGAATSAAQTTGNASLASIDGKITAVNTNSITFSAPQHIIVDNVSLAVTGTFWQGTQPVSNAGTFAVQAEVPASATSIGKILDAAVNAFDVGVPAFAMRKAVPANISGTDGDYELIQMNAGRLWTSAVLEAGSAVIGHVIFDNASLAVTGTFWQATQPVSIAGSVAVTGPLTDTQLRATAVPISVATIPSHAVTNAGTFAVQTEGKIAAGVAATGNPDAVGGRAATALPTAVSDAQIVNALFSKYGQQIVRQCLRESQGRQVTNIANTTETTIVTADASNKNDIFRLMITNKSATAVNAILRDDTAGSAVATFACPPGITVGFGGSIPMTQTTINKNWTLQMSASVSSIDVTAEFIKAGA